MQYLHWSFPELGHAGHEHDTACPVDGYVAPQLHTHAVVFNVTERDNGQPRAIQPQSVFASQQFATAIYQSELTYRLRPLGYEITTGKSGAPEIIRIHAGLTLLDNLGKRVACAAPTFRISH